MCHHRGSGFRTTWRLVTMSQHFSLPTSFLDHQVHETNILHAKRRNALSPLLKPSAGHCQCFRCLFKPGHGQGGSNAPRRVHFGSAAGQEVSMGRWPDVCGSVRPDFHSHLSHLLCNCCRRNIAPPNSQSGATVANVSVSVKHLSCCIQIIDSFNWLIHPRHVHQTPPSNAMRLCLSHVPENCADNRQGGLNVCFMSAHTPTYQGLVVQLVPVSKTLGMA